MTPEQRRAFFRAHAPIVVQLAYEAPMREVRAGFRAFLRECARAEVAMPVGLLRLGASSFVPRTAIVAPEPEAESQSAVRRLFRHVFLTQGGRVSHVYRVLAFHPRYALAFQEAETTVFRAAGPLPEVQRMYCTARSSMLARLMHADTRPKP